MFNWLKLLFVDRNAGLKRVAALVMLAGAGLSLLASLVLSIEALVLAKDSNAVLNCDLNAAFSCSVVANHWSAELLGFPNSFIGLATLPVMVTVAVALLAGVKFPRWFMVAAQIGACAGLAFAGWMLYMSLAVIQVLCPWCLTTDVGMLMIFYGLTRHNILTGVISGVEAKKFVNKGFDTLVLALVLAAIVVTVLAKFGTDLF